VTGEQTLAALTAEDRIAIEDTVKRYCRAVDRCDWDLLRSVFHPEAVLDHGAYQGGVDGFLEFVASRRVGIVHSAHYVGNVLVDVVGADRAVVEAYGWAVQTFRAPSPLVPEGAAGVRFTSTYRNVDVVARTGTGWRIREGHLVLGDLAVEPLDVPPAPRPGLSQRPSTDDPLYTLLRGDQLRHPVAGGENGEARG